MRLATRVTKLNRRERSQVERVMGEIVKVVSELKGGWAFLESLEWKGKRRLEKEIERICIKYVIEGGLKRALGEDLIGEDGIPMMDSKVYRYLKVEWYKGDIGKLIRDLSQEKRRNKKDWLKDS